MEERTTAEKNGLLKANEVSLMDKPVHVPQGVCPPGLAASGGQPTGADQPEVEYVKDDQGVVKSVVVYCPCGRQIHLQCEYMDGGKQ